MVAGRLLTLAHNPSAALLARTILFVEDEDLVRDTIARELEEAGFVVLEATTGEEALEILDKRPVGLLFTDIRLPGGLDGWRIAEYARSIAPTLPVVYATGYSSEQPRLVSGGVLLRKPYLPSTVFAILDKLLSNPAS